MTRFRLSFLFPSSSSSVQPYRLRLTHELISSYQLLPKLACFEPVRLSRSELIKFHCDDFIDFLREVTPAQQKTLNSLKQRKMEGEILDETAVQQMINMSKQFNLYGVDGDWSVEERRGRRGEREKNNY